MMFLSKKALYGLAIASANAMNPIAGSNREIAESNRVLAEKVENASAADIKARDRVDISLAEYESMKKELEVLRSENAELKRVLSKICVPYEEKIIVDSIEVARSHDPRYLLTHWQIRFDTNEC